MRKILFITSSRADYGLMKNLILETQKINKETYLLVTGSHLSQEFGGTYAEIKKDNIKKVFKRKILEKKFKDKNIQNYLSNAIKITSNFIKVKKPDVIVILGDRYELLGCAIAAMLLRVPIAHIHGGELSIGAYDDSIRHSITKLSHLHFPIHETYKKRLIQMGENPKTIFNFGSLGSYSINKEKLFTKKKIEKILNINLNKKILLVTFHPVTLEKNKSQFYVKNLIKFLEKLDNYIIIISSPNFDSEAFAVKKKLINFSKKKKNVLFKNSLGRKLYLSLMKIAFVVIGNSSSGVLETPSFGVRTINIGDRQKGRITTPNIINCDYKYESIKKAFYKVAKKMKKTSNPFLKKNTARKIANKLVNFEFKIKKEFFDIKF